MYLEKGAIISGDAGHNCNPDRGASSIRFEDQLTKEVWGAVQAKLRALGYNSVDCTPYEQSFNSVGDSLAFRVNKANGSGSAFHLCVHFNAGGGKGVECYVSGLGGNAEQLAKQICDEISKLGYYNRGVKTANLYVPKYTNMSCVLVECSFVDSQEDMDRYNADSIANAIVKAVTNSSSTEQPKPVTPPVSDYKVNAKVLVDLDPRSVPNNNYVDLGEIFANESIMVLPEVCDLTMFLPIKYWKDSLGQASDKVWVNANQSVLLLTTNAVCTLAGDVLDARYTPSYESYKMGFIEQGERVYVHQVQNGYALATYFAGSGHKTAWFTARFLRMD